jgi:hypothetical protein
MPAPAKGKPHAATACAKLRLGAPLVQKSRIVRLFVAVGQALEGFLGFAAAVGNTSRELIGDGKAEKAEG